MTEDTESTEYQAAVEKIRSHTSDWESWLAREPSLEAVQSLADALMTDEEAVEEMRELSGKTRPRRA